MTPSSFGMIGLTAATALSLSIASPAQAYPIDCAILLCLAGGWPASAECTAAKAEFIRRITPLPIEPPLQIWRCPMGVAYKQKHSQPPSIQVFDAALHGQQKLNQSFPISTPVTASGSGLYSDFRNLPETTRAVHQMGQGGVAGYALKLHLAQQISNGVADIDISGPDYDFIRSIRVWDVRAYSSISGEQDDNCNKSQNTRVGLYDKYGSFAWHPSDLFDTPPAFVKPIEQQCQVYKITSVFVDWRDHAGAYGWERVDYGPQIVLPF